MYVQIQSYSLTFICFCLFYLMFFGKSLLAKNLQTLRDIYNYHPEIRSIKLSYQSKLFNAKHSDTYPDPKIGLAFRNYPYSDGLRMIDGKPDTPGMTGVEYSISQEIPFVGKLTREYEVKKWEALESQIFLEKESNRFFGNLFGILVQLQSIQTRLKLLESIEKLTESINKLTKSEYTIGKKEFSILGKTYIDKFVIQEQKTDLEGKYRVLLSSLEYYVIDEKVTLKDIFSIPYNSIIDSKEIIYKQKVDWDFTQTPRIKQIEATVSKLKQEEKLGELFHYPDTEIFFAYMKRRRPAYMLDTGLVATAKGSWEVMDYNEFRGDLFSFGATIKLPVWSLSKNKYLQYKNSLQRQSIEEERKKFELTLKVELQTQIELWKAIDKRLGYMEKEHLNMLNQNLNSTLSHYQTGKVKYSEVVLSQIELLNLKLQIEELKAQKNLLLVSVMEMLGDFTTYLEGGN